MIIEPVSLSAEQSYKLLTGIMYLARLHGSHPGQRPKLSTGLSAYLAFTGGHLGPMADVFYSLALFIAILHCHNVAPSQPWQLLHELVGHALSNLSLIHISEPTRPY